MLDIDHGTYPFVTSSSATPGCGDRTASHRPQSTCDRRDQGILHAGRWRPFPTEALNEQGDLLRARGNEYGAVTGRPRRCGWLDCHFCVTLA